MFLVVSICLSGVKGVQCDNYTSCIGPHCTSPPAPALAPSDMGPHRTGHLPGFGAPQQCNLTEQRRPASDIWWPSLETFSNLFTSGTPSVDIWWLLKHG